MFKNKRGYWVERVTGADGKKKTIYAHTPAELEEKLLAYAVGNARQYTFAGVAEEWWSNTEQELAMQTVNSYELSLRDAISYFEESLIDSITPADINAYLQFIARKGYAQGTVRHRKIVLTLIFKYAVINGFCKYNPCREVSLPKGLKTKKRGCATDEDEQTVRERDDIWILFSLCFFAGLRRGEALALRPCDIDWTRNLIYVRGSIAFADGGEGIYKEPKTEAGVRAVPMLPKMRERLQACLPLDAQSFFCNRSRVPMSESQLLTRVRGETQRLGLTSTPHQFRHSFATLCFERGLSPKATQTIIGHKNLATTMDIYTDARADQLTREASKLFDL
jgi:site-specific recombinase XerD